MSISNGNVNVLFVFFQYPQRTINLCMFVCVYACVGKQQSALPPPCRPLGFIAQQINYIVNIAKLKPRPQFTVHSGRVLFYTTAVLNARDVNTEHYVLFWLLNERIYALFNVLLFDLSTGLTMGILVILMKRCCLNSRKIERVIEVECSL